MSFEITGNVIVIDNVQQITDTFKKREFVIETNENKNGTTFTEVIKFQTIQDRCAILDAFKLGDSATVSFNIKGRKWEKEGKVNYFTNLEAWRVVPASQGQPADQGGNDFPPAAPPITAGTGFGAGDDGDDLPF
ncbi:MAG: hypothetical protein ACJATA_001368 [Sphingobacteriales bacterium]|jgi:hypothetical protein